MDYKKAAGIRKKGLTDLIAEKKFKEGQGLGSSIGQAISEKMKAKSMGFKEKFHPLNMVRAMTGSGAVGKSIRTVAGRAIGASEEDIKYFGGYGKKKKLKQSKDKKDPLFTTVGENASMNLEAGDSSANILAKIYRFMEKTQEVSRLDSEIEQSFREEQLEEEERRHKKLIEALTGKKLETAKPEDNDGKSFFEKLLSGIKSALSLALAPLLGSLSILGKFAKNIVKLIPGISALFKLGNIFRLIFRPILLVGSLYKWLSPLLKSFMTSAVGPYVALLLASAGIRAALEGGEDLKESAKLINRMQMIEGAEPLEENELSEDYKELKKNQMYRELPIPGTDETLKAPLDIQDIKDYANLYKDYIDAVAALKNYKMNVPGGSVFGSEESKQKAKELEGVVVEKTRKVFDKLKEFSGRLNPRANIAKEQKDTIEKMKVLSIQNEGGPNAAQRLLNNSLKAYDTVSNFTKETWQDVKDVANTDFGAASKTLESLKDFNLPTANDSKELPSSAFVIKDNTMLEPSSGTVIVNGSRTDIGGGPPQITTGDSTPVRDSNLQKIQGDLVPKLGSR